MRPHFLRLLLTTGLVLAFGLAVAATEVNLASQAELESIQGIGTGLSSRILEERGKGRFTDWADLIRRVKGLGPASAARFSAAGLTVEGQAFQRGAAGK